MWNYIKVHASKLSNTSAFLQGYLKLHKRPNSHSVETLSSDTTCDVPKPWDKAKGAKTKTRKGAKINTNLSLKRMDIDKLLLIWLTIHQIN